MARLRLRFTSARGKYFVLQEHAFTKDRSLLLRYGININKAGLLKLRYVSQV